jgi:hypothetical protein
MHEPEKAAGERGDEAVRLAGMNNFSNSSSDTRRRMRLRKIADGGLSEQR